MKITYNDIKNLWLSVESSDFFTEDWSGTVLDVLNMKNLPDSDKLWIVINDKFISTEILEEFTENCKINVDGIKGAVYRARYALSKYVSETVNHDRTLAASYEDCTYATIQSAGTISLKLSYKNKVSDLKELLNANN